MQTSHQKPAVEQSSQIGSRQATDSDLQREVLHYLKEFGPVRWAALYVRFDSDHSGAIGPALQDLQIRKYIVLRSDSMVNITPLGMVQL